MDVPFAVGSGLILIGGVVWVVCAIAAYQRAPGLGRRAWVWGLVTLIGGPIALFIRVLLPRPKHQSQARRHDTPRPASGSEPVDPHHNAEPHHHNQHKHHDNSKHNH